MTYCELARGRYFPLGGGGLGGGIAYAYNPTTGSLETITAPDGGTLNYTWDGFLLTGTTWIGAITGSVTRTYDSDFRTSSLTVNGDPVNLTYDADSRRIRDVDAFSALTHQGRKTHQGR